MTSNFSGAFARYQQGVRAAITHEDRSLTPKSLIARRLSMIEQANANLSAVIPTVPEIPGSRAEILDSIRPTTADEVAVARHQRERIQADLDRGRRPEQIIASADLRTIVALLDWLPTMPGVKDSNHRDEIQAEIEAIAFQRLADLGHEPAVQRLQAEQEIAAPTAVARVFTEALAGPITTSAWQDLHRADPEMYREIQAGEIPGLADEARRFGVSAAREAEADRFDYS